MTEIDLCSDQGNAERGATAATDLQLESEQRATQALHDYQCAAHAAADTAGQGVTLPSLQLYSDLPREWPMARLGISNKQVNRLVRTFLWRRAAERACGALDPSLGQSMSFPSLLQLRLPIEVPLWRDLADAKRSPANPLSAESDTDSDATGSKERSPRYAQPVPVGAAEPPEAEAGETTEEEDLVAEPTYTFAQGYGRFVIGYTRLATALGNFEQGNVQTESAVVAHWLTSGLRVAMSRIGWNLLSPRHALTRLPGDILSNYYYNGYPLGREEDRPYHQYGRVAFTENQWDRLCAWLTGDPMFRRKLERRKQALKDQMGNSRDDSDNRNKARRTAPPQGEGSSSSAARSSNHSKPPPPPPPHGWWQ